MNSISPGLIETEMAVRMQREEPAYYQEKFLDVIPMGRSGSPLEIAKTIAFMCDSEMSFMTGHNMVVDGGWLA